MMGRAATRENLPDLLRNEAGGFATIKLAVTGPKGPYWRPVRMPRICGRRYRTLKRLTRR
jgi:hypothetical protein